MKRFLVLIMLALMPLTGAAAVIDITLSVEPDPGWYWGEDITVNLTLSQDIKIISNNGSIPGIGFTVTTVTGTGNTMALGSWQNSPSATGTSDGTLATDKLSITGASANWLSDQTAGTVLYSFEVTMNGFGTISVADLDDNDFMMLPPPPGQFYTIGTVTSIVMEPPEPTTISLLGLGDLLLRRREKVSR
jgi:hypothetical protein